MCRDLLGTVKFIIDGQNEGATVHYWEKFGASANWARLGDPLGASPLHSLHHQLHCTERTQLPILANLAFPKNVPNAIVL